MDIDFQRIPCATELGKHYSQTTMRNTGQAQIESRFECPHCQHRCGQTLHCRDIFNIPDSDGRRGLCTYHAFCPSCHGVIVYLVSVKCIRAGGQHEFDSAEIQMVLPNGLAIRRKAPAEVPAHIGADYSDATALLTLSPNASAAMSRRCLQAILRNVIEESLGSLYAEIKAAISHPRLSRVSADFLNTLREIGNQAAHPNANQDVNSPIDAIESQLSKDDSPENEYVGVLKMVVVDQLVEVSAFEAEFCISVLEHLMEEVFVKPARLQKAHDTVKAMRTRSAK